MTPEAIKEYKANEHHHHEDRGPLWVEPRGHECEVDVNAASPLASCRGGAPKVSTYEPYDTTRPAIPGMQVNMKQNWSIPKPGSSTPAPDFPEV